MGAAVTLAGLEALAVALSPWLLVRWPLLLVALSPSGRHIALAVLDVGLVPLVLVATGRRVLALAVTWLLGAIYGRAAIAWAGARFRRLGRLVAWTERLLGRVGLPLLVVAPGFTPSMLAGVTGIPFWPFLLAVTAGNAAWCAATAVLGEAMADWTGPIVDWLSDHVLPATAVAVALVFGRQLWTRLRRGRGPRLGEEAPPTLQDPPL